jgi:outer membrane lipoprotein SlyB
MKMTRIVPWIVAAAVACGPALTGPGTAHAQGKGSKCANCGRVAHITAVEQSDWKKYAAPAAGAVAGGVIGNQFGGGSGKTALTVVGALGGAFVGHKVEEKSRDKAYDVVVAMDDGSQRTVTYKSAPPVREGDRVRLRNGQLVLVEQ